MRTAAQVIEDYYRFLKLRERDKLLALLADDMVLTYHGQPGQLPWAGVFHGVEGFDRFFGIIREHIDIVEVTIVDSVSAPNRLINRCQGAWRYKATGYVVEAAMVNAFTVENEKITACDIHADTAAFLAGLPAAS